MNRFFSGVEDIGLKVNFFLLLLQRTLGLALICTHRNTCSFSITKRSILTMVKPIPMVDPITMVDPIPMADPIPMVDSMPMVDPMPKVEFRFWHLAISFDAGT